MIRFKRWLVKKRGQLNSIQARLMLSAFLMVLIILPTIGFILNNAFQDQITIATNNELSAHSYSILALAEIENEQLFMPSMLLENQFNVSESGLYALFTISPPNSKQNENTDFLPQYQVWQSGSLLGLDVPGLLPLPALGQSSFTEMDILGDPYFIYSFSVNFNVDGKSYPRTLHILRDQADFLASIKRFKRQLLSSIIFLMVILLAIQFIWLAWVLYPLKTIEQELVEVEQGKLSSLNKHYPLELQRLVKQLNDLLYTEQSQRKRYRNSLSDLAHSLKTPLAVLYTQKDLSITAKQQLSTISNTIEHQLKRAQSVGDSAWHIGIKIQPISTKLLNSLTKIYRSKDLDLQQVVTESDIFKGDEADLMEMLGNLLDNACKSASSSVRLTVNSTGEHLVISVEDDGVGVDDLIKNQILQRGTRADTYAEGHGIGLAIVRDLVESYQGQLDISQSHHLGGALFSLRFKK